MRWVFLLDVDNTLLDNDAAKDALAGRIRALVTSAEAKRFWELYDETRTAEGIVDLPATAARFAREYAADPCAAAVLGALHDLPYERFLCPGALEALAFLWHIGTPVVLSDGDPAFQPRKIARSGITAAVRGNVLVYGHKDEHLTEVLARFPADRYALVDDRAGILARTKARLGERVLTVHVLQGHYASEPAAISPDIVIARIADLPAALREAIGSGPTAGQRERTAVASEPGRDDQEGT